MLGFPSAVLPPALRPLLVLASLGLVTIAVWTLYSQALPGRFLFDDIAFLGPLSSIHDGLSALVFIVSGDGGPLGRPIALATFALQAGSWPDNPAAMLRVNFAIHLLTVWAVFLLATGLVLLRQPAGKSQSQWIGLAVSALWGLSPFLATTHLMIWQRVTSLSGLFVMAGLAAFVWAHLIARDRSRIASSLLVAGLGMGTFLAAFSKENGALLPLLALVILALWIPRPFWMERRLDRGLIVLLAMVPSLLVLGYLISLVPGVLQHGYGPERYYSPEQRLMSQPAILLEYLSNLLLPRAAAVTPFMDRLPAPAGWLTPPLTLIAGIFWPALAILAVWVRRPAPYLVFGLAFFLTGHLVESSIVGVELYFAHRNYVPSFGLYFALVYAAATVPAAHRRLATLSLTAYGILFALVLWQATNAWSEPDVAAEIWWRENPHSERATQFLAAQYLRRNDPQAARRILDETAHRNPGLALIQIQRTQLCLGRENEFPQLRAEVTEALRTAPHQIDAITELAASVRGKIRSLCAPRDLAALTAMTDALWANPAYSGSPKAKANLLMTKGFIRAEEGHEAQAVALFLEAYKLYRHLDMALYAAALMVHMGELERASSFLQGVRAQAPSHPVEGFAWRARIDIFMDLYHVAKARASAHNRT